MGLSIDGQAAPVAAADIIAWTEGWVRSRGHAAPTPIHGGVHIRVGSDSESARYVLTAPDTDQARELAAHVTEPNFWIKWPARPGETPPAMPGPWQLIEPQFFMGAQLEHAAAPVPDGYHLTLDDEGDALEARITTDTETVAARGRVGLSALAVPDQIVTRADHQRRGLGRAIMVALSNAAVDRGRSEAVLLASDQGRHLYSTLGWRLLTPFWAAVRPA